MRILERLEQLYLIGGGPGANRVGYSAEEDEAHALAAGWLREAGLAVEVDPHGNLIGRLAGSDLSLPEVWTGSHLDSVPHGGRFDGALGVVAGIEAVERLGQRRATLAVVVFRDEERGCTGSRAFVRDGRLPGSFLELHHEQGPRLAAEGLPLGIVTAIAGYIRGTRTFAGHAGHAGTTPMAGRDDALVAAATEILRIRDVALAIPDAVATVGRIEVESGTANTIPGSVTFTVDARAPDVDRLDRLVAEFDVANTMRVEPAPMRDPAVAALRAAVEAVGLPVLELPSGAGHDAGVLATAGVAAGMLFVRAGNGGISHSPDESATDDDVALGLDVLADALARLAG